MCVCVCACMRACVRACVCACCVCAFCVLSTNVAVHVSGDLYSPHCIQVTMFHMNCPQCQSPCEARVKRMYAERM